MLVTDKRQRLPTTAGHDDVETAAAGEHSSDSRDVDTVCPRRLFETSGSARRDGKQEFVVFSAGQRDHRRILIDAVSIGAAGGRNRQHRKIEIDADLACLAEVSEIAGEPVGDIDGRCRPTSSCQPAPFPNARSRAQMSGNQELSMAERNGGSAPSRAVL